VMLPSQKATHLRTGSPLKAGENAADSSPGLQVYSLPLLLRYNYSPATTKRQKTTTTIQTVHSFFYTLTLHLKYVSRSI
jgi:hypothetical protein